MTNDDAERSLPATYLREFVDLCGRFDVAPDEVLRGSGFAYDALTDTALRVPLDAVSRIGRRAAALTGEPALAYYVGLHMRISWHGFLGFAAMTAPTIRDALKLAERYAATKTMAVRLSLREEGDVAYFLFEERVPLARDLHEFLAIAIFSGLKHLAEGLTGTPVTADLELSFREPSYLARFRTAFPGEVRFDRPVTRAIVPRAYLDLPLVSADPIAMELARTQCERELAALAPSVGIVEDVRKLVMPVDGVVPGIEDVASRLHVSTRTLKRRLAERATTFSDVVDEVRHAEALVLLGDARLSIDEVASRLGYSDTANFARAFRRWTGTTPGAHRRGSRDGGA